MAVNLTEEQREKYENIYKFSKGEIEAINAQIEKELAEVKDRITKLNAEKQAVKQVYEGACARLNIPSEFDKNEESDSIEDEE